MNLACAVVKSMKRQSLSISHATVYSPIRKRMTDCIRCTGFQMDGLYVYVDTREYMARENMLLKFLPQEIDRRSGQGTFAHVSLVILAIRLGALHDLHCDHSANRMSGLGRIKET